MKSLALYHSAADTIQNYDWDDNESGMSLEELTDRVAALFKLDKVKLLNTLELQIENSN